MALLGKALTEREKSALYMFVFGGCEDWKILYQIALPKDYLGSLSNLTQYASQWKQTQKVKDYLQELEYKKKTLLQNEFERGMEKGLQLAESEHQKREMGLDSKGFVDYSNPTNQTRKLNELINLADDQDSALDALKVLIASQKQDTQGAKEGKQVRAYLPINCTSCPLYAEEREKTAPGGSHYGDNVNGNEDGGDQEVWR